MKKYTVRIKVYVSGTIKARGERDARNRLEKLLDVKKPAVIDDIRLLISQPA
jgi:hypothetical protein